MKKVLFLIVFCLFLVASYADSFFLKDILRIAEKNNPEIQGYYNLWQSARSKADGEGFLPDPQIKFSYFVNSVETRVGPQIGSFGIVQVFPWFGKLKLKKDIALKNADILYEKYLEKKLEVAYKVKKSFYKYYLKDKRLRILEQNVLLLNELENLMQKKYSTGKAKYVNLIKIQIDLDLLKNRVRSTADLLPPIKAELLTLLNIDEYKKNFLLEEIKNSKFEYDASFLSNLLHKNKPLIKTFREILFKNRRSMELAAKATKPDFSIGFNYVFTKKSMMLDVIDNGKDPLAIMLSMKIPVWKKRNRAKIVETELFFRSNKKKLESIQNVLELKIEKLIYIIKDAERKINLYSNKIIPDLDKTIQVVRKSYEAGMGSFSDLIELNQMMLKYKLLLEENTVKKTINIAEMEFIIGKNLYGEKNG